MGVWTRARRRTVPVVRVRARHRGGGFRRGDRVGVVSARRKGERDGRRARRRRVGTQSVRVGIGRRGLVPSSAGKRGGTGARVVEGGGARGGGSRRRRRDGGGSREDARPGVPRREAFGEASRRGAGDENRGRRNGRRLGDDDEENDRAGGDDDARDDALGARELVQGRSATRRWSEGRGVGVGRRGGGRGGGFPAGVDGGGRHRDHHEDARAQKIQKGGEKIKVEENRRTGGGRGRSRPDAARRAGRGETDRGKGDDHARSEGGGRECLGGGGCPGGGGGCPGGRLTGRLACRLASRLAGQLAGRRTGGTLCASFSLARGGWGGRGGG